MNNYYRSYIDNVSSSIQPSRRGTGQKFVPGFFFLWETVEMKLKLLLIHAVFLGVLLTAFALSPGKGKRLLFDDHENKTLRHTNDSWEGFGICWLFR